MPRGDVAAEAALSLPGRVDLVTGVIRTRPPWRTAIPQGLPRPGVIDQFYSPNYARIIAYTSTDMGSDEGVLPRWKPCGRRLRAITTRTTPPASPRISTT